MLLHCGNVTTESGGRASHYRAQVLPRSDLLQSMYWVQSPAAVAITDNLLRVHVCPYCRSAPIGRTCLDATAPILGSRQW